MLVWGQGSIFDIAAVSLPVQKARGQTSLYRGQIQKLLQFCQKPYQTFLISNRFYLMNIFETIASEIGAFLHI